MDFDALINGLDRHTLDGITRGSIYALVALGYTMVYGVMKLINFAHSEVFMVGTWATLGTYTLIGASSGMGVGMIIGATVLALLAAMLASAGTALAVEGDGDHGGATHLAGTDTAGARVDPGRGLFGDPQRRPDRLPPGSRAVGQADQV